jgi:hypothetical protein
MMKGFSMQDTIDGLEGLVASETPKVGRLSISLPNDLWAWVRLRASQEHTTVSAVVAEAIRHEERKERNARISRALMEDAEEEQAMAENW